MFVELCITDAFRGGGIAMELSKEQIQQFNEEGYIFLPSCFSKDEITVLNKAAAKIYKSDREEVWRESSGAARTAFAAHT